MNLERRDLQIGVIKTLPFALILAIFYLHDFFKWYSSLLSYPWAAMFVFALSISIFGAVARRRLIVNYADLSVANWYLGIVFLLLGAGFYIYGTISSEPYLVWAQFESALFFVLSYISMSYDWRIVRSTALLFIIVGLAFPSPFLLTAIGIQSTFFGSTLAMTILFLIFAERDFRLNIAPLLAYSLVFLYFFVTIGKEPLLMYLIPFCFALYAHPTLRRTSSVVETSNFKCRHLWPIADGSGFCSSCGSKYVGSTKPPRLGIAGLVLIFIILFLLSFPLVEIPVLQLYKGSTPQYNIYNYQGVSGVTLPATPQGWLTNSTTLLSLSGDLYASKNVYVPVSNPSTSNYTLYYELSPGSQANLTNAWGNVPSWNRVATPMGLIGLSGFLIIYTPTNASSTATTLIVYSGNERVAFLQPFGERTLTMQLSFTRNFSSSINVNNAVTIFVSDIQAMWQGQISNLNSASSWSSFIFSTYSLFLSTYTIIAIIASASLILFASYRAMQSDFKTDRYLEIASGLDEMKWLALSSVMSLASSHPITELELENILSKRMALMPEEVRNLLGDLEQGGLLQRVIWERGHDVMFGWRTSIKFGLI